MLPPALDIVRQLVATPSVSSPDDRFDQSNRGVIDLVADWAAALGFTVRIEALPGDSGKANLIATRGEGEDGLVLSGHTDTVPYNAERWTDDPFVLTERDGKLHGLGTADMKGFFAAALHAIASAGTRSSASQRAFSPFASTRVCSTCKSPWGAKPGMRAIRRLA
jgi:acetylornithine deacetylase